MKYLSLILPLLFLSCEPEVEFIDDYSSYVADEIPVHLDPAGAGLDSLFTVTTAETNGSGYSLYDPSLEQFLRFDRNHSFENAVGSKGSGPYEFQTFTVTHYGINGYIYLYDLFGSKIIGYGGNESEHMELVLEEQVIDMAADKEGNLLVYHLTSGREDVLSLFDRNGEKVRDLFVPEDESLKIFLATKKTGSVQYHAGRDRFYFLYPDRLDLYEITSEGEISDTISYSGSSPYTQPVKPMPGSLNPYEPSDAHKDYWASSLHPTGFYFIGEDHILVQNTLWEKPTEEKEINYRVYYNLYSMDGVTLFEGVHLDEEIRVKGGLEDGGVLVTGPNYLRKIFFRK